MNVNFYSKLTAVAMMVSLASTTAFGQYTDTNPVSHCKDGQCNLSDRAIHGNTAGVRDYVRDRYQDEMDRLLNGYDRRAPLDSAVEDRFRSPVRYDDYRDSNYRPEYNYRTPEPDRYNDRYDRRFDDRGGDMRNDGFVDRNFQGRLENPFRIGSRQWENTSDRYQTNPYQRERSDDRNFDRRSDDPRNVGHDNYGPSDSRDQRRYRMPLSPVDYRSPMPNRSDRLQDPFQRLEDLGSTNRGGNPFSDRFQDLPAPPTSRPTSERPSTDPFVPPLPRREGNEAAENIYKAITNRYSNPVTLRAIQSMSSAQALNLYTEVSTQTDRRHLEPSSYDLRVRRGLRNLQLALENPAFLQSNQMPTQGFQVDGLRNSLARLESQAQVRSQGDAIQLVQSAMQIGQQSGLPANVVAFEFANSTVETLDKFSALEPNDPSRGASLNPALSETRSAAMESEIVGIGVEVKQHDSGLLIMKALRGGPAVEAGLKSGDIITAIDGRSITNMPMANSVDLMKGSNGSRIRMAIVRDGQRARNITLARRRMQIYTVNDLKILPQTDNVAYLNLSQFGQKSTQEIDQALNQLYNQGMKSLIVDLRGNPGGLLNVCVDITNRFLPCGTIVSTKGRLSTDNMLETADYSRTWSTPLVVLIDEGSASASEIFAAAVQDNRRGIVIGQQSYGKGTVQTHFPLSSISGNLRLTTARFYSPSGRAMSGSGVTPDINIEDADGPINGDQVLSEAIQVAQSQRLKDIAQASRSCTPNRQPQRNSLKPSESKSTAPKTVWK
ncbi:MAG: S41 family peptidase [Fuerstiella sp.]